MDTRRRLYRSEADRIIAGVAAGMAEHFDWEPTVTRLVWLLALLLSVGLAFFVYLALWLMTPSYSRAYGAAQTAGGAAVDPASRAARGGRAGAVIIGGVLVVIGALALASSFGAFDAWDAWRLWPLLLVALGAVLLLRR